MALKQLLVYIKNLQPFHLGKIIFRRAFILPTKGQKSQTGIRRWSKVGILVLGNLFFTLIPEGCLIYEAIKHKEWMLVSSTLADAVSLIGICVAFILLLSNHRRLSLLFEITVDYSEHGIPEQFDRERYSINLMSYMYVMYLIGCCLMNQLLAILNETNCKNATAEFKFDVLCKALMHVPWLFNVNSPWPKILWMAAQFGLFCCIITATGVGAYLIYELCSYIVIRIQYLNSKLLVMFNSDSKSVQRSHFIECAKAHKVAFEQARELDAAVSLIMFVHFTVTAIVLGSYLNLIIKRIGNVNLEVLGDIMFFLAWLYTFFLACFSGEKLKSAFEEISDILYQAKWYTAHISLRKDFQIMQVMCMQPVVLTTGAFGTLSFALFVSVMKTAYSFVTLMQQTMD